VSTKLDIVTSSHGPSEKELTEQVDRILHSGSFRGSEILRNLLSYLLTCAHEHRVEPVKVKEIARAVFGRSEDFDSQSDSVVRVHTGRLRSKLAEYYMSEGVDDDVIVTIPKGSYALSCHFRPQTLAPLPSVPDAVPDLALEELGSESRPRTRVLIPLGPVILLILLSVVATWFMSGFLRDKSEARRVPPALRTFWRDFVVDSETPLIVFSNFRLIGSVDTALRGYNGPDDPQKDIKDTYTTMGEVMGVFEVSKTFSLFQKPVRAKRGRLLTWDEAKDSNLIFVGGPLAQTPLRDVPVLKDLQFRNGEPAKAGAVVNLHPRPGENSTYVSMGAQLDYAVIALRPGLSQHHRILVLAGVNEYGTQGATEFVTREEHVNDLLSRLKLKPGGTLPWFESLLRVKMEGGVPVQTELVFVHQVD
jgi:hypothetical protein